MFRPTLFALLIILLPLTLPAQRVKPPAPVGALPSPQQMEWQQLEYYAFVHFNMNTFTDEEWGHGKEQPNNFNPTALDCRQWARVAKEAGMKGIILTAKHHDGFCLWPSAYTKHSVRNSSWKNGQGDVLRELSQACKEYGLKFGLYVSPWDRNHPTYGTPEYNEVFKKMLAEVLTQYGEVFEVWFDGANGEGPNGKKQVYDWPAFEATVFQYQPRAIIFSDDGPGCRWVGNEQGYAGETNWSTLNRNQVFKGYDKVAELNQGHEDGTHWIPAETDVSIRPGWYYHASEDHKVKTLKQLSDIYYASVGRNSNLLLNLPVDRRGLVHEKDAARLKELKAHLDAAFAQDLARGKKASATSSRGKMFSANQVTDNQYATYWATPDGQHSGTLDIHLGRPQIINQVLLQEYLPLGQRVQQFRVQAYQQGQWQQVAQGTTMGYKRILRFPDIQTNKLRLIIDQAKGSPTIATVAAYRAPKLVEPPVIRRNLEGYVKLEAPDAGLQVFYTLDGSQPNLNSPTYREPFRAIKQEVRAISYDPETRRSSEEALASFDVPKQNWSLLPAKVTATGRSKPIMAIDEDPTTVWFTRDTTNLKLEVDLGESMILAGFTYLPPQGRNISGTIAHYTLMISNDGKTWTQASAGEFANIKNSPVQQLKKFTPVKARYIRFKANQDIQGARQMAIAEFGVITQ